MRMLDKKFGKKIPLLAGWLLPSLSSGEEDGDVDEDALLEVWDGLESLRVSGTVA